MVIKAVDMWIKSLFLLVHKFDQFCYLLFTAYPYLIHIRKVEFQLLNEFSSFLWIKPVRFFV
ncbi:hypothetical protein SAMN04487988_104274 [Algoriphagus hitonicola]|uniref:Uncharacterized protein n=1 Tax=Algoriphagus hitonicola TaxID=435880 RepID=A0A1I2SP00_9BACT|nr:hypothetical protein SAMN04487988_104274 [Algoriphagus hitonicola]